MCDAYEDAQGYVLAGATNKQTNLKIEISLTTPGKQKTKNHKQKTL